MYLLEVLRARLKVLTGRMWPPGCSLPVAELKCLAALLIKICNSTDQLSVSLKCHAEAWNEAAPSGVQLVLGGVGGWGLALWAVGRDGQLFSVGRPSREEGA